MKTSPRISYDEMFKSSDFFEGTEIPSLNPNCTARKKNSN